MHNVKKAGSVSRKHFSLYNLIGKLNDARCKTSAVLAVMFIFANTVTFAATPLVNVKVYDNNVEKEFSSVVTTVGNVLDSKGINVGEYDVVHPSVDSLIKESQVIVVERVKKVVLDDGGVKKEYLTTKNTVGDFLNDKGIQLGFYDKINTSIDSSLKSNNNIEITRVVKTTVSVDESIPFRTVTERSDSYYEGTTTVVNEGKSGIVNKKYDVFLTNGVETDRVEVSSEVTVPAVDKMVYIGSKPVSSIESIDQIKPASNPAPKKQTTTTSGRPTNYKKVLTCTATAYDLSFQSCGKYPWDKGYGITASGTRAKYGTVAVDPRVIPLGTKLYIESVDGKYVYGYATAEDTGGAIKGHKVDLFYPSYNDCMQFGRRSVKVYILN